MGGSKMLTVDVSMEKEKKNLLLQICSTSALSLKETFTEGAQSVSISWINTH